MLVAGKSVRARGGISVRKSPHPAARLVEKPQIPPLAIQGMVEGDGGVGGAGDAYAQAGRGMAKAQGCVVAADAVALGVETVDGVASEVQVVEGVGLHVRGVDLGVGAQ